MRLWMLVASELATHGSVIAKQERVLPSSSGSRNRSRWKGVANLASNSMLPVSGAEQFVASCDSGDAPISSHSGAYSRVVSPAPSSLVGEEQVPEATLARLGLELLHDRRMEVRIARRPHLLAVHRVRRIDAVADEVGQPVVQLPGARARLEVHAVTHATRERSRGQQAHLA